MRFGKLTTEELQTLVLDKLSHTRSEIALSAAQGEDCAAAKTDEFILLSSDPITAAMPPKSLGELVLDVCCNDIRACGGEPFAIMLTVIVPPNSDESVIGEIMSAAALRAKAMRVDVIGGHTEFSDCVTRPIVSGTAIGKAKRVLKKTALKEGEKLFVTKSLGMEGTVIMADGGEKLDEVEKTEIEAYRGGLGVDKEGEILRSFESVGMMHDITEGGVLGAVAEVCLSVGLGAQIYESKLPIGELTKRLCRKYGLEPSKLISSGSMLFSASGYAPAEALRKAGIPVCEIGEVIKGEVLFLKNDGSCESVRPGTDEMYKYFLRSGK